MNSQIVRVSNGVSERNSLESVECRLQIVCALTFKTKGSFLTVTAAYKVVTFAARHLHLLFPFTRANVTAPTTTILCWTCKGCICVTRSHSFHCVLSPSPYCDTWLAALSYVRASTIPSKNGPVRWASGVCGRDDAKMVGPPSSMHRIDTSGSIQRSVLYLEGGWRRSWHEDVRFPTLGSRDCQAPLSGCASTWRTVWRKEWCLQRLKVRPSESCLEDSKAMWIFGYWEHNNYVVIVLTALSSVF